MRPLSALLLALGLGLTAAAPAHATGLIITGGCPSPTLEVENGTPGGQVAIVWSEDFQGTTPIPTGPCAGTSLDLGSPINLATIVTLDAQGDWSATPNVPPFLCPIAAVQAVDLTTCDTTNLQPLGIRQVPFPSVDSTVEWGGGQTGLLGSSPQAGITQAGDGVFESFPQPPWAPSNFGNIVIDFQVEDATTPCINGVLDIHELDITIEGVVVHTVDFIAGTGGVLDFSVSQGLFPTVPIVGDLDIGIVAADDTCLGGGAYRIVPGGTFSP